jgi:hypothetical protein
MESHNIYGHFHIFCDMSIKFLKIIFRNAVLLFKELKTYILRKYNVLENKIFFDETPWVWIFNTDFCFHRSKNISNFNCNIWVWVHFTDKTFTDDPFHRTPFHRQKISPSENFTDGKFHRRKISPTENFTVEKFHRRKISPTENFTDDKYHRQWKFYRMKNFTAKKNN